MGEEGASSDDDQRQQPVGGQNLHNGAGVHRPGREGACGIAHARLLGRFIPSTATAATRRIPIIMA